MCLSSAEKSESVLKMTSEAEGDKAIRVIPFDGKKEHWHMWSKKFLAKAIVKKYKQVLLGEVTPPPSSEVLNLTTDEGKAKMKIKNANELAYNDLLLSCTDEVTFGYVDEACTDDLPDGDAALAWKNLLNKFEPTTAADKVSLLKEFADSKLDDVESDPDTWYNELATLRQQLKKVGTLKSDEDMMVHILNNLPKEYENTVELCERRIGLATDPLTLDDLRAELRSKYKRLTKANDKKKEEVALVAAGKNFQKQFKGKCRNCGKIGHKAVDCKKNGNSGTNNQGQRQFQGKCFHCGIPGHRVAECRKKKAEEARSGSANIASESAEVVLMAIKEVKVDENIWVADSAASGHMSNSLEGMYDLVDIDIEVTIGDGFKMKATKQGKMKGEVLSNNGNTETVTMVDVKYVPALWCNLFSLTKAMDLGFQLSGNKKIGLQIRKGDFVLPFDQIIKTGTGFIIGAKILRNTADSAMATMSEGVKVPYPKLHEVLGHPGEAKARATAKYMGWQVTGKATPCENCAIGKAKQKNVPKTSAERSKIPGERLYLDISSIKGKSYGNSTFWALLVDDSTNFKWSFFLKQKSDLSDAVIPLLIELRDKNNKAARIIRCDNAGENKSLEQNCKKEGLVIAFEYTAPGTPQQNGVVERAFATLYGRVRAMMNEALLPKDKREGLWTEAAATATKLENIMTEEGETHCPHVKFFGELPKYARELKTFGEIGIAAIHENKKIRGKLDDRGRPCMFVGYAKNHAGNVYRMLNLKTNRIILTRDIIWLKKLYGEYKGITEVNRTQVTTIEDDDDDEPQVVEVLENEEPTRARTPGKPSVTRLAGEVRRLRTSYNPLEEFKSTEDDEQSDLAMMHMDVDDVQEPDHFYEAWNHPDSNERKLWRKAIQDEVESLNNKMKTWKKIKRAQVPRNRTLVGSKWVFKIKRDGRRKARLVAQGFSQVPGQDFNESFAPVVNEISFRVVLLLMLINDWDSEMIDVETAYLHGDLDEEIYMRIPIGLENVLDVSEDDALMLLHNLYGLVQGGRSFWKKFRARMRMMKFKDSQNDACLMIKRDEAGVVIVCTYVDDNYCVGNRGAIDNFCNEIGKHFTIKKLGPIKEYIGCEVIRNPNEKKLWLWQPDLIKKINKKFGEKVANCQRYKTPASPGEIIMRPQDGDALLSKEEQTEYQSGTGSLLYAIKHSRPDMANAVRELSKVMDGATKGHQKSLYRAIKYFLDTKSMGLVMKPNMGDNNLIWKLKAFSDSDFSGDKERRHSISGYIIYLMDVPIAWRSKSQRNVTLSATEAEYVALSEVCAEIMFIKQIMEFLGVKVELPIMVHVDNLGAIYMANNEIIGGRTRHVDVRYHFVKEFVENGVVKVIFVKSDNNDADLFTKNVRQSLYEKHSGKMIEEIPEEMKSGHSDGD